MTTNNRKKTLFKKIIWLLIFLFLLVDFTIRKTHQFRDFSPTVIVENQTLYQTNSKIYSEFKAEHNNLGTVSFKFDVSKSSSENHIIFRIKNKNQDSWFYENIYPIDPSQQNNYSFFPFGFPIIENSKNETYQIEIFSVDGKINSIYSPKTCNNIFLSKYSFPKAFLLNNKEEIPIFIFQKIKSFFNHLNLQDLLSILIILFLLVKLTTTNFFKQVISYIKTINESKIINQEKKLLFSFPIFLSINTIIAIIVIFFKGHTESNEWLIYEAVSIFTFFGSIFFFIFLPKIKQIFFKKFFIFSLFISFFIINYWFVVEKISLKYIFVIFCLSLIPAFYFYKKNISSFIKIYLVNAFLLFNIIYFFILDVDNLNNFIFLILLFIIYLLFLIFRKYSFNTDYSFLKKIIISFFFIGIASLITFYKRDIEYHHYSFYIGPVYEIAHHKSILNNFPSQYGYLPIHLISTFLKPFNITFQSFHILNLISFVIYFVIFYLIYLKLTKNLFLVFFASTITTISQIILSIHSSFLGPSAGPLRFGPGLIIILSVLYLPEKIKIPITATLSAISLFWSAETAVYVIPAWIFFVFYYCFQQKYFLKNILKNYLFFLISIIVVFLTISIYEYKLMNQFPNFINYIQYPLAYQEGLCSELIPLVGNHFISISILLSGLLMTTYFLIKHHSNNLINSLSFISIHNIAIFSYFISRSNQNNTLNIFPFLIVEFFIICKIIKEKFNIKLYQYIALPIFFYTIFLLSKCIQNEFSLNSQIIRQKQKSPDVIQQYNSIKDLYGLSQKNVLIISKNFDSPIILDNKIETVLPLNPSQMTSVFFDKYLNPNFNKVAIGTTVVYSNDYPDLFNIIEKHYALQKVEPKTDSQTFSLYTIQSIK